MISIAAKTSNHYKKMEAMLYNYKITMAEVKNIELEIEFLSQDYTGCGGISYEERSGNTNKFNSAVENEAINKQMQIEQLERKKYQKELQVKKINNALEVLSIDDMNLIKLRYFDKLTFKVIGCRLNMSSEYLVQKKSKVIKNLSNLIFL